MLGEKKFPQMALISLSLASALMYKWCHVDSSLYFSDENVMLIKNRYRNENPQLQNKHVEDSTKW